MERIPARILPGSYRWTIRGDDDALLHRNYGGAAHVFRSGARYRVTISDGGASVEGPAATLAQGMRHAERWIDAAIRRPRTSKRIASARRGWRE